MPTSAEPAAQGHTGHARDEEKEKQSCSPKVDAALCGVPEERESWEAGPTAKQAHNSRHCQRTQENTLARRHTQLVRTCVMASDTHAHEKQCAHKLCISRRTVFKPHHTKHTTSRKSPQPKIHIQHHVAGRPQEVRRPRRQPMHNTRLQCGYGCVYVCSTGGKASDGAPCRMKRVSHKS